jgi:hypothetical protein
VGARFERDLHARFLGKLLAQTSFSALSPALFDQLGVPRQDAGMAVTTA